MLRALEDQQLSAQLQLPSPGFSAELPGRISRWIQQLPAEEVTRVAIKAIITTTTSKEVTRVAIRVDTKVATKVVTTTIITTTIIKVTTTKVATAEEETTDTINTTTLSSLPHFHFPDLPVGSYSNLPLHSTLRLPRSVLLLQQLLRKLRRLLLLSLSLKPMRLRALEIRTVAGELAEFLFKEGADKIEEYKLVPKSPVFPSRRSLPWLVKVHC